MSLYNVCAHLHMHEQRMKCPRNYLEYHHVVCIGKTKALFSRQPSSRLTFLGVVSLQTLLSDLKMIRVFTGKIK